MRLRICGSKGWLWGERSEPLSDLRAVAARRAAPTDTELRRARCKPRARREGGFAGAKRRTHGEAERDSRARAQAATNAGDRARKPKDDAKTEETKESPRASD